MENYSSHSNLQACTGYKSMFNFHKLHFNAHHIRNPRVLGSRFTITHNGFKSTTSWCTLFPKWIKWRKTKKPYTTTELVCNIASQISFALIIAWTAFCCLTPLVPSWSILFIYYANSLTHVLTVGWKYKCDVSQKHDLS